MGWEWSRLGSLSFDSADGPFGSNLKREHYTSNREVRIIQLSNIGEFGWKDSNVRYTTFAHLANISRSEAFAGDIIIAKMMPAGRAIICPTLESKYVLSSDAVRFSFSTELEKTYLYYAINSPVFLEQVYGEVQGITRVRTSLQKLRSYLLPIPPINEQKKIVEIIDQLLTLTFNYEKAQDAINELNDHLKPLLKRSILQEAIQGRLVEQCETDEPASVLLGQIRAEKEKLAKAGQLKKSALQDSVIFKGDDNKYYEQLGKNTADISDAIPYDIPNTWAWCRLSSLICLLSGRDLEPHQYNSSGIGVPYITGASNIDSNNVIINRWTDNPLTISHKGDILLTCKGTIGKMAYNKYGDMHIARQLMAVRSQFVYMPFLHLFLSSYVPTLQSNAQSIIPGISREVIMNALFALPPYQEQIRIATEAHRLLLILQ